MFGSGFYGGRMDAVRVVPANEVSWDELQSVLAGSAARCQCQRQRLADGAWFPMPIEQRAALLRAEVGCDDPGATDTTGVVALLDGEPVAWAAVDRRMEFQRVMNSPVAWQRRPGEPRDDGTVWSIACLVVRKGFRGQGLTYPLVAGAARHALASGASAVEGYPMIPDEGRTVIWDEFNVGPLGPFLDAGFEIVSRPTPRRAVVRKQASYR